MFNIAILNIKCADYCCVISRIGKREAIKLIQNNDFTKQVYNYKKNIKTKYHEQFLKL